MSISAIFTTLYIVKGIYDICKYMKTNIQINVNIQLPQRIPKNKSITQDDIFFTENDLKKIGNG